MINVKFMAPDKVLYQGEADHLVARSTLGEYAIYKDHIAIVTTLDISKVKIVDLEGKDHEFTVSGGYLYFENNTATILTKAGENLENIDIRKAEIKKEKIEKLLKAGGDADIKSLELDLKKQINRINQAKK